MTAAWPEPPAELVLDGGATHVWRARLDAPIGEYRDLARTLSANERRRAAAFLADTDRRRFVTRRGILRTLLARYLGGTPSAVEFRYGPHGKPELRATLGRPLRFSCTHSRGLALYAVTAAPAVGIDVEALRPIPDLTTLSEACLSAPELAALRAVPAHRRHEMFFHTWTRKEAYLKAVGTGLSLDLDQVEVSITPDGPPQLLRVGGSQDGARAWSLHTPVPGHGYVAALAVAGATPSPLSYWSVPALAPCQTIRWPDSVFAPTRQSG